MRQRNLVTLFGRVGLAGLLVRMVLIPFTLHIDPQFGSDIFAINRNAYYFVRGIPRDVQMVYPPLFLFSMALFQIVVWPLLPATFREALLIPGFHLELFQSIYISRFLALSKSLYLLFDLLAVYWMARPWRNDLHKPRAWLWFWALNPLILYGTYLHGQFDVIPLLFVVLGLYAASQKKLLWASIWLGLGACSKGFPLMFLFPAAVILARDWCERFKLLLIGTTPYVLLSVLFLRYYQAGIGDYSNYYFKVGYDLGFGAQVYIFFIFYAALLWYLHHRKAHTFEDFWRACFAILLVYYQFSYFDLHYWAWIVPFAAIYWVEYPQQAKPFYLVIGLCLLVLLTPTPLGRFLAPISPRFFLRLPSLLEVLNSYLPMLFIVNVVRSLMAGTCFYLAWRLLRDMPASRSDMLQAVPA